MPFVFVDHTADMGVRITAGTLNQLFEQAAEAFLDWYSVRPETAAVIAQIRASLAA